MDPRFFEKSLPKWLSRPGFPLASFPWVTRAGEVLSVGLASSYEFRLEGDPAIQASLHTLQFQG